MPDPAAPSVPFDPALADAVCRRVGAGRTLTEACDAPRMPERGVVLEWAEADPAFAERLDAARRRAALMMAEDLADHCRGRNLPPELKPATPGQQLARDRLIFVTLRMLMSIYDPQTFGRLRAPAAPAPFRAPVPEAPRAPAAAAPPHPIAAPPPPPPPVVEDPDRAGFRAEAAAMNIDAATAETLLQEAEAEGLFDAPGQVDEADAPVSAKAAAKAAGFAARRRDGRRAPPSGAFALARPSQHALLCGMGAGGLAPAPLRLVPDTS